MDLLMVLLVTRPMDKLVIIAAILVPALLLPDYLAAMASRMAAKLAIKLTGLLESKLAILIALLMKTAVPEEADFPAAAGLRVMARA